MGLNVEDTATLQDFGTSTVQSVSYEEACLLRIDRLQTLSRKGLWGGALFMALSAVGYTAVDHHTEIPAGVFALLGTAPPVSLISLALVVYCFSALILTLPRIVDGSDSYRGWSAVAYLAAFYGFYFYAQALDVNFWAVFAAGVLLLTLEYVSLLIYCRQEIRREQESLNDVAAQRVSR
jgi:hypothetical protein